MKERRKKRIFCLVLSAGMMLLLTACSPGSEMSQGTPEMDSSVSAQTDEAHGNSSLDTLDSDSSNVSGTLDESESESANLELTGEEQLSTSNEDNLSSSLKTPQSNTSKEIDQEKPTTGDSAQSQKPAQSVASSSQAETASEPTTSKPEEPTLSEETEPEPAPEPSATDMGAAYKANVLAAVNSYRQTQLGMDSDLSATAQAHAEAMALSKSTYHFCRGVESVGSGAYDDGYKQGVALTLHCSALTEEKVVRIGVGAACDENGSIYVCIFGKTY